MMSFKPGDKVRIKPEQSISEAWHGIEGEVLEVLDAAKYPWFVRVGHLSEVVGYADYVYVADEEIELLEGAPSLSVEEQIKQVIDEAETLIKQASYSDEVPRETPTGATFNPYVAKPGEAVERNLALIAEIDGEPLDQAIEYLNTILRVYETMHNLAKDKPMLARVYALVHDEVKAAVTVLEQIQQKGDA